MVFVRNRKKDKHFFFCYGQKCGYYTSYTKPFHLYSHLHIVKVEFVAVLHAWTQLQADNSRQYTHIAYQHNNTNTPRVKSDMNIVLILMHTPSVQKPSDKISSEFVTLI